MSLEDAFTRIYERAYDVAVSTDDAGKVTVAKTIKDPDLDVLYQALHRAAQAMDIARDSFEMYGRHHRAKLQGTLTLVERIDVEAKAVRNEMLAQMLRGVLLGRHQGVAGQQAWLRIETAPINGDEVKLLGRLETGEVYREVGRWEQIRWSVEAAPRYLPPTHWAPLDPLPPEYRST